MGCSYNPHKNNVSNHISHPSEPSETCVNDFCNVYNLSNLVKEPTCFENPDNPSCIDLFLIKRLKCFQSAMVIETGVSCFHNMVITVLKIFYKKKKAKITHYKIIKLSMPICLMKN